MFVKAGMQKFAIFSSMFLKDKVLCECPQSEEEVKGLNMFISMIMV